MNWPAMTRIEPELRGIERDCRAAKQQGANWHDFWSEHVGQLTPLVGPVARCPGLRSDRAWKIMHARLLQTWIDAMGEPATLPWDSRPPMTVDLTGAVS